MRRLLQPWSGGSRAIVYTTLPDTRSADMLSEPLPLPGRDATWW